VTRYGKRGYLIVPEEEPFNAEAALAAVAENPVTATDAFYVRGHGQATPGRMEDFWIPQRGMFVPGRAFSQPSPPIKESGLVEEPRGHRGNPVD
jgi:hypothetical protein